MMDQYKERLLYAVGKYSDYSRYSESLSNMESEYDETLETYNFDMWFHMSEGTIQDKARQMLQVTGEIFMDLRENAEHELYSLLCEIAGLDEEGQREICGTVISRKLLDREEFGDLLSEWESDIYVQQEALEKFLEILKRESTAG